MSAVAAAANLAPAAPIIRYTCAPCEFCQSTPGRTYTTTISGAEWSDVCHFCNGKGTVIVEVRS